MDEIETYAMVTKVTRLVRLLNGVRLLSGDLNYAALAPSATHFWPRTNNFSIFEASIKKNYKKSPYA